MEDQVGLFVFRLDATYNVLGGQGHYPENQHVFYAVEGQVNQQVHGQTSLVERVLFLKMGLVGLVQEHISLFRYLGFPTQPGTTTKMNRVIC